eukprot:CAMPEP_0203695522 /NCGR_PEP_ID=MMETSP0091-20130426/6966_1 /ASSEMBLY_ACC=CAM_ASM_001089 /TAXON_ID=426623 /ORGANISM="Chaetoceros affinis, Strain CCMP159" /LENGTH=49 /DNA_ID= /DNA_START= /DNA_END= /DNA_ORIENTATION=
MRPRGVLGGCDARLIVMTRDGVNVDTAPVAPVPAPNPGGAACTCSLLIV